jgi:hypothetical protein
MIASFIVPRQCVASRQLRRFRSRVQRLQDLGEALNLPQHILAPRPAGKQVARDQVQINSTAHNASTSVSAQYMGPG